MTELRLVQLQDTRHIQLGGGVGEMVCPPDDMGNGHGIVIHHRQKHVEH